MHIYMGKGQIMEWSEFSEMKEREQTQNLEMKEEDEEEEAEKRTKENNSDEYDAPISMLSSVSHTNVCVFWGFNNMMQRKRERTANKWIHIRSVHCLTKCSVFCFTYSIAYSAPFWRSGCILISLFRLAPSFLFLIVLLELPVHAKNFICKMKRNTTHSYSHSHSHMHH